jgi:thioredoxin reductase (NADPH)
VSAVHPTVIGRRQDVAHHELRDFLTRTAQPHDWLEAGSPEAGELLSRLELVDPPLPVVVDGADVFAGATVETLADAWHSGRTPSRSHYELAIIGAGPRRSGRRGLCGVGRIEHAGDRARRARRAGLLHVADRELLRLSGGYRRGRAGASRRPSAEQFGAELLIRNGVESGRLSGSDGVRLTLAGGSKVSATVAIAAAGMESRRLEVPGVEELRGRGVYYGAGRSEAAHCAGDAVVVVGAGNAAGQAVLNLANVGAKVTMVVRGDRLGESMSAYLVERIDRHPLVEIRFETQVVEAHADDGRLAAVTLAAAEGATETRPDVALFLRASAARRGRPGRTPWEGGPTPPAS